MSKRPFNTVLARLGLVAAVLATLLILAPAASAATARSYPENGTDPVATFSATDQDLDAIVWSVGGRDAADFTIVGGVLRFKVSPDYESPHSDASGTRAEKNVYKVTVEATGGSEAVTVTVTNVDEDGSASLDQYQPQVDRSLLASVSDPDSDETNQEWQWARGESASGSFTDIEDATNPSRSPTTDDAGMYLRASVTYTDSFGSGKTASVVSGRAVEDTTLANARPSFEGQDQTGPTDDDDGNVDLVQDYIIVSRSVAENSAVGTAIGEPVRATDPDGDVLIYKLDWSPDLRTGSGTAAIPSGDVRFSIDRGTGQVKVAKKLNYEAADDSADKSEGGTLDADPIGGAIEATLADNSDDYVLRVRATDPSGAYSNVNVTITLTDANEAPTFAEASEDPRTAVTVIEGTPALLEPAANAADPPTELNATTFVAADVDDTPGTPGTDEAIASYALEGADAGNFEIGNDSTNTGTFGQLTIDTTGDDAHTPNYEKQSSYSITIVAISGVDDRRLAGRLDVTIKVTNAEDAGSVELSQIQPREGLPVTATLKDEDGSINISTWQWQYVDLQSDQVCNPDANQTGPSGTWTNIPKATSASYTPSDFVFEGATVDIANNCLRAMATYTDGIADANEPDTAMQATDAVVQVAGAVNSAPKFPDQDLTTPGDQSDETSRTVAENTSASTNIGSAVTAGDTDDDLRLYTLGGPDGASFGIDRKNGQIKTKAALDYEALPEDAKYYMVMVTATDPSGATDSIMVTINVTDVNDGATITVGAAVNNPPAFDSDMLNRSVDENMDAGTDVGDPVMAMDDASDTVTYELSGSMYFAIDENDGQISTTMMLDYEAMSSHMVTVTATDSEDATDTVDVTISVGDMYPGCTVMDNNGLTTDCEMLLEAKMALGGSLDWTDDADNPITSWEGVTVSGDPMRVTGVWLRDKSLGGTIPAVLNRVEMLTVLNLHSNNLSGPIPDLSGTMLVELYLAKNYDEDVAGSGLTGGVPVWLNDMTGMTHLWLWGNMLDGSIPDLSGMTSLVELKLNSNMLSGGVPMADMLPPNATWILLQKNPLGGMIPDLSSLTSLRTLWLHTNELTGSIPATLPTSVTSVNLKGNSLSGMIPDLSGLQNLQWLRLQRNELSGEIPGTLGDLGSVTKIWLYDNQLTGIGTGFGNAADTLTDLFLMDNPFAADTCLPGGLAMVENNDFEMAGLAACAP